jgi:hypothetical protein
MDLVKNSEPITLIQYVIYNLERERKFDFLEATKSLFINYDPVYCYSQLTHYNS